jgi:hypothetical protein
VPPRATPEFGGGLPRVAGGGPLGREPIADRALAVCVTSGTGMSTAFAIGEETVAELFGAAA